MSADLHFTPIATFSGLRGVPLIALSRNWLYPALTIGADSLTIRVVRRHRLAFRDIRKVGFGWLLAWQLTIIPERGWRSFSANSPAAACALKALRLRGVALDGAAIDFPGGGPLTPTNTGVSTPRGAFYKLRWPAFCPGILEGKDLMNLNTPQVAKLFRSFSRTRSLTRWSNMRTTHWVITIR
jgi:hypothetical protein